MKGNSRLNSPKGLIQRDLFPSKGGGSSVVASGWLEKMGLTEFTCLQVSESQNHSGLGKTKVYYSINSQSPELGHPGLVG